MPIAMEILEARRRAIADGFFSVFMFPLKIEIRLHLKHIDTALHVGSHLQATRGYAVSFNGLAPLARPGLAFEASLRKSRTPLEHKAWLDVRPRSVMRKSLRDKSRTVVRQGPHSHVRAAMKLTMGSVTRPMEIYRGSKDGSMMLLASASELTTYAIAADLRLKDPH